MHIFAGELLTSGGWAGADLPESLLQEGRAMLSALLADLCAIEDVQVTAIYDAQQERPNIPEVNWVVSSELSNERELYKSLVSQADVIWFIAPEIDGLLKQRQQIVIHAGRRWIGPDPDALALTADKFHLAEHCQQNGIPTIPTRKLDSVESFFPDEFPLVIKPRFGAGSERIQLIDSSEKFIAFHSQQTDSTDLLVQPFIAGQAISVAAIFSDVRPEFELLPICQQNLSDDGRFRYLGGQVPAQINRGAIVESQVNSLIRQTCDSLPGFSGYVGFDVIVPDDTPDKPLLVEINPRLTTSYLGYRELTTANLAERILFPRKRSEPIFWENRVVRFTPTGQIFPA